MYLFAWERARTFCFHYWVTFSLDSEFRVQCFSGTFNMSFHRLLTSHCFWWTVSDNSNKCFPVSFFSVGFQGFLFSLWFSAFDYVSHTHGFLHICSPWVCRFSWIWKFMLFANFQSLFLQIVLHPIFFLFFWDPNYIYA